MPEELSLESKLFVKEEIEKIRKDIKEEVEKVKSKTTKTFATVVVVVGLLTGLGIYGSVTSYISTTIQEKLGEKAMANFNERLEEMTKNVEETKGLVAEAKSHVERAKNSYNEIVEYEKKTEKILYGRTIIGIIVPYGGKIESTSGDPCEVQPGWFFCNGARLKRSDYPLLYNVIKEAFGAPTPDTFNLPDLRGRFVRGVDHGAGNDPDARFRKVSNKGGNTGNKVGSVQDDELKKHKHQWRGYRACGSGNRVVRSKDPIGSDDIQDACFETGGNETRPKNVYVNWIIKAQ